MSRPPTFAVTPRGLSVRLWTDGQPVEHIFEMDAPQLVRLAARAD